MKNDIFTYGTSKLLGLMANKHKVTLLEGSGVTDLTAWPGIASKHFLAYAVLLKHSRDHEASLLVGRGDWK